MYNTYVHTIVLEMHIENYFIIMTSKVDIHDKICFEYFVKAGFSKLFVTRDYNILKVNVIPVNLKQNKTIVFYLYLEENQKRYTRKSKDRLCTYLNMCVVFIIFIYICTRTNI